MQIPAVNSPPPYPLNQNLVSTSSASEISAEQSITASSPAKLITNEAADQNPSNDNSSEENTKTENAKNNALSTELNEEQKRQVNQLKTIDREVRAHEAAHIAAAGGLVRGGANFSYQKGPDGRRYAVGGEVSIDTSPVRDNPQATIQKAQTIRAAALAPAKPSSTDRSVASAASQMEVTARGELAAKKAEELRSDTQDNKESDTGIIEGRTESVKTSPTSSSIGVEDYQRNISPNAPSDLLGQLLNISA